MFSENRLAQTVLACWRFCPKGKHSPHSKADSSGEAKKRRSMLKFSGSAMIHSSLSCLRRRPRSSVNGTLRRPCGERLSSSTRHVFWLRPACCLEVPCPNGESQLADASSKWMERPKLSAYYQSAVLEEAQPEDGREHVVKNVAPTDHVQRSRTLGGRQHGRRLVQGVPMAADAHEQRQGLDGLALKLYCFVCSMTVMIYTCSRSSANLSACQRTVGQGVYM